MKYKWKLDSNLVTQLQRLDYAILMRKTIINDIINYNLNNTDITNTKMYKKYWNELEEFTCEFEMLKSELEKLFIPKELNGHKYSWIVDYVYNTFELTINCDCGNKIMSNLKMENLQ